MTLEQHFCSNMFLQDSRIKFIQNLIWLEIIEFQSFKLKEYKLLYYIGFGIYANEIKILR